MLHKRQKIYIFFIYQATLAANMFSLRLLRVRCYAQRLRLSSAFAKSAFHSIDSGLQSAIIQISQLLSEEFHEFFYILHVFRTIRCTELEARCLGQDFTFNIYFAYFTQQSNFADKE